MFKALDDSTDSAAGGAEGGEEVKEEEEEEVKEGEEECEEVKEEEGEGWKGGNIKPAPGTSSRRSMCTLLSNWGGPLTRCSRLTNAMYEILNDKNIRRFFISKVN